MRRWFKCWMLWLRVMWAAQGRVSPRGAWRIARALADPHHTWEQLAAAVAPLPGEHMPNGPYYKTFPPRPGMTDAMTVQRDLARAQPTDGRAGRRGGGKG